MSYSPKAKYLRMDEEFNSKISSEFTLDICVAIVPVTCESCQKIIQPEEIFTRSRDKKGTKPGFRYTHCIECIPIKFR